MGNPYATVVILSKNPPAGLFEDLRNQTFQNFEIIVAKEKGIVNAMNKALEKARGEIFVRIDDDVSLPKQWLQEIVHAFDWDVAGVTGPTYVRKEFRQNRDSIRIWEKPNWFLKWLTDGNKFNPGGIYNCGMVSYDSNYKERFLNRRWMTGCDHLEGTNWAMRTDYIREVGGFDPKFDGVAEWFDTDVEFKIKGVGAKLRYSTGAYLYHNLGKGAHFKERFEAIGRIKNWLRFHFRHSKFHYKKVIFLIVWILYFVQASWRKK